MKKILSILFSILYVSIMPCFAFSELYLLPNTQTSKISKSIDYGFLDQGYKIIKRNPYYGVDSDDNSKYAVVILQMNGNDLLYYYNSNGNKKINKRILKQFKNAGIQYEKSQNTHALEVYDNLAQKIVYGQGETVYTFEEEQPAVYYNQNNTYQSQSQTTYRGSVVQVPKGSSFGVYLQNPINTSSARVGDRITAVLTSNWTYNGSVVAPQGSLVYGTVTLAHGARYGSQNGRVVIDFNQIVTPSNITYNISTEKVDFSVTNEGKFASTAQAAVTGAVIGALAGLAIAAISRNSLGQGAAIGAGIGGGGSLITSTAPKGIDAEIPSYTELELTLSQPFKMTVSN